MIPAPPGGDLRASLNGQVHFFPEVSVLRLQPGDVLVVKFDAQDATREYLSLLQDQMEALFPGHRVVVMRGCEVEVLRGAD